MINAPSDRFTNLWNRACAENPPNPKGATGDLITAFGKILNAETVEVEQIGKVALFLLDLSTLGLKGMDFNVVMVTRPAETDEDHQTFARLIGEYKTTVRSVGFCFHVTLQKSPASNPYGSTYLELVNICGDDLERLFQSKVPGSVLFGVIRRQQPLRRLCPFNITREARGAMFRGRKNELNTLVDESRTNFIVTGARLIGKTSLLKRASDILALRRGGQNSDQRAFYFDCSVWGDFWDCDRRVAHDIKAKSEYRIEAGIRNFSYMLERLSLHGKQPLRLFFDEFDRLVDSERQTGGWEFTRQLHEATAKHWVYLTFAGFRSVPLLNTDNDSPFYGSLEVLELKPLSQTETKDLLCDPFVPMDIRIRDQDAVAENVQGGSAGHPFLVQFYGERLFQKALTREPQEVWPSDVDEINDGYELNNFLIKHFLINTMHSGVPALLERMCAFVYAASGDNNGWAQQSFHEACRQYRDGVSYDEIDSCLEKLVAARVFTYSRGRYRFTFPLLRNTLNISYPKLEALLSSL